MAIYRVKNQLLALSALFLIACSDPEFKTLDPEASFRASFNGFKDELILKESSNSSALSVQDAPFLLVFFTKECGVCSEQIAILEELVKRHQMKVFVILNDAKDRQDALAWAKSKDLSLPLFYENKAAHFFSQAIGGVFGVPVLSFWDKKHKAGAKFLGLTPLSVLESELKRLEI